MCRCPPLFGHQVFARYRQNIAKRISMERRHRRQIRSQRVALACLKLLEQELDGLLDELLRGFLRCVVRC